MADLNDLIEDSNAKLSRRNVVVGTAWAVPAIMAVGAAPAFAASLNWTVAASRQYVNIANQGTPVEISGTGVTGQTGSVASPGLTSQPFTVDGDGHWSVNFSLGGGTPADGTIVFTPTSGSHVFSPATVSVIKDTVAPTVLATQMTQASNNKTGTISGTKSEAGTVSVTVSGLTMGTYSYDTPTTWSVTWSGGSNNPFSGSVTVTDSAGNPGGSDSFSWPKNAASPYNL